MTAPVALDRPSHCARCQVVMQGGERRMQSDGRVLCASCHGDRRWCTLPLLRADDRRAWPIRALTSLVLAWAQPARFFGDSVVTQSIRPFLALCLLVRLPFWLMSFGLTAWQWQAHGLRVPMDQPHVIDGYLGAAFADVLALWMHCMVPFGVPVVVILVGVAAHLPILLTLSTTQTIASTLRVSAIACAGVGIVVGTTEVLRLLGVLSAGAHAYILVVSAGMAWIFLAIGLARTHRVPWLAGAGLALFPALVLMMLAVIRPLLLWPSAS